MLAEEGAAMPVWDTHETLPQDQPAEFPLDAFFIPEYARSVVTSAPGDGDEIAGRVAERLDELSRRVRERGLTALGETTDPDELTRLLAGVIAGFVTRRA